jgi:Na+-translocating ferredoxin:NAD+ oxidoreductase RNF subunit RnfB
VPLLKAILALGSLGFILGLALALAYIRLAVRTDPRKEKILEILPGSNCGACGYAGCEGYATRLLDEDAPSNLCTPGGEEVARGLAEVLGVEVEEVEKRVAVLRCKGGREEVKSDFTYLGLENCRAAYLVHGGSKTCKYGCIGLGTCAAVCPFNAITMGQDGLPAIAEERCTGCGLCVEACPVGVIHFAPLVQKVYVGCSSHDKGKVTRKVCTVGCIACKVCEKNCPYDAIHVTDDLAEIDYSKCTSCGICVHKCPTKSIVDKVKVRPYAMIGLNCDGCGKCVEVCKFKAIEGEAGERHKVLREECIGCGLCFEVCEPKAITMVGALGHKEKTS